MLEYITFAGSSDSSAQMRTELGARSGNSRVKGIAPSPVEVVQVSERALNRMQT